MIKMPSLLKNIQSKIREIFSQESYQTNNSGIDETAGTYKRVEELSKDDKLKTQATENNTVDNSLYEASSDIEKIANKIDNGVSLSKDDMTILIENENSDYVDIGISEIYRQVLDNRKTIMDNDARQLLDRHLRWDINQIDENSNHNAQTTTYEAENHYNKLQNTPKKILDAKKQETQDSHYETFSSINATNAITTESPYSHYETASSIDNQSTQNKLTPKELGIIHSQVINPNTSQEENHYENANLFIHKEGTKFQDMLKQRQHNQTEVSGPG